MKFYRLHKYSFQDSSLGFEFFATKREAQKAFREFMGGEEEWVCDHDGTAIDIIEVEPTKAGILRTLNRYAKHPDNG